MFCFPPPMFSKTCRVLKLRFLAFSGGPGGFRELREAGRNHFHLSWYLLVPVITSYERFSLNGPCQRGGYTSCRFLVVKNTLNKSRNLRPKRSLNERLGHSKIRTLGEGYVVHVVDGRTRRCQEPTIGRRLQTRNDK